MVVFDNFLIPGNLVALVMYYWAFAEIAITLSLIGLAYTVSILVAIYLVSPIHAVDFATITGSC